MTINNASELGTKLSESAFWCLIMDGETNTKVSSGDNQKNRFDKLWNHIVVFVLSLVIIATLCTSIILWDPRMVQSAILKLKSIFINTECNGNGIWTTNGCFCDLGYQGPNCSTQVDLAKSPGAIRAKSLLVVLEHFSSTEIEHESAVYYAKFANFFANSNHQVEVLVTEPKMTNLGKFRKLLVKKVKLLKLPEVELQFDNSKVATTSYLVMRYIYNKSHYSRSVWETIMFLGSKGIGYYTIFSQRQGVLCFGSHLMVIHDAIAPLHTFRPANTVMMASMIDKEAFMVDYLQQKSIEMADTIVLSSKTQLEVIIKEGWHVSNRIYILSYLTVPIVNDGSETEQSEEPISTRAIQVKEFVFVGEFSVRGGLNVLLGAIDNILSHKRTSHWKISRDQKLKLTFYGWNSIVHDKGDMTGEDYIKIRTYKWENRLKWKVSNEKHLGKILKYLTETGKGRAVVIPAIEDLFPFFLHQVLQAGIPVIASNLKSLRETVHIQDRGNILFAVNDTLSLTTKLLDVLSNGVPLGRSQAAMKQSGFQWKQLLADIRSSPQPQCSTVDYQLSLVDRNQENNPVTPIVSVLITHPHQQKLLQQAVASIEAQTLKDLEVIIAKDENLDPGATEVLSESSWIWRQKRKWRMLEASDHHLETARNIGAKYARGKYTFLMDHVDIIKPTQLELMVRVAEISGADVVTTGYDLFTARKFAESRNITARFVPLGPASSTGAVKHAFQSPSMLVRRQFFLDSNELAEKYEADVKEYDFSPRTVAHGNHLETCTERLHWYRQNYGIMSRNVPFRARQVRFTKTDFGIFSNLPSMTLLNYTHPTHSGLDHGVLMKYDLISLTATALGPMNAAITPSIMLANSVTSVKTCISTTTTTLITPTIVPAMKPFVSFKTPLQVLGSNCSCQSCSKQSLFSTIGSHDTCFFASTQNLISKRVTRPTTLACTHTLIVNDDSVSSSSSPMTLGFVQRTNSNPESDNTGIYVISSASIECSTSTIQADTPLPKTPIAISAEYSSGGEYVSILFDRPVNAKVGYRFRCDRFLIMQPRHIPTGALLGNKPEDCLLYFPSQVEMRVMVDPRYTHHEPDSLKPGKSIVFRDGVLSNIDPIGRAFVSGTIDISIPANPELPNIIVDAPEIIGACEEFVSIDLSRSSGSVGRFFVDARFDFNSTVAENDVLDSSLRQFLHAAATDFIKSGKKHIDIPTRLLTNFTVYTFRFTLWNIFGVSGNGYATMSKVSNQHIPVVNIEGPLRVREDEVVQINAILPSTICDRQYNFTLDWKILDGPKKVIIHDSNKPTVTFPIDTLSPGNYLIGLQITITVDRPKQSIDDRPRIDRNPANGTTYLLTHRFTVLPKNARLEIIGGNRLIGYEDTTRILLRIVDGNIDDFDLEWKCLATNHESPCEDANENEINLEGVISEYYLHGKRFKKGIDMKFTVIATHKQTRLRLTDWIIITISQDAYVPCVEIAIERPIVTVLEPALKIMAVVTRSFDSARPYNHTFRWETLSCCKGIAYATIPVVENEPSWVDRLIDFVEISPALLLPGAQYCFRATVTDGNTGLIGWAFRVVQVREPPSAGYCELVSSAVSFAFKDRFTVACHGWSGPNVRYRFKIRINGDLISLAPPSSTSQITFTTDVGQYELEVDIIDKYGLTTTVPVQNISAIQGDIQKEAFLALQLSNFEKTKNPRLGHEIIALTATNIVPNILASRVSVKMAATNKTLVGLPDLGTINLARVMAMIDTMTQSTHIDAHETGPYFLDFLQRILPSNLLNDLCPLLLHIIQRIAQAMSLDQLKTGTCFSSHEAIKILRLMEPVFNYSHNSTNITFIIHEIKNILELCIQRTMYCGIDAVSPETVAAGRKKNSHRVLATKKARSVKKLLASSDEEEEDKEVSLAFSKYLTSDGFINGWNREPFSWFSRKQAIEFGLIDTRNLTRTSSLCGFNLPYLRGMATLNKPCLGYRCTLVPVNLMRNNSIDHFVMELSFRNATQILAPWFRTHHMTFAMPLSAEFQARIKKGGKPSCVWYDRRFDDATSGWSNEGCRVIALNVTHVQCACSHLTEFSIMIKEVRTTISSPLYLILGAIILLLLFLVSFWIYRSRRRGPPTFVGPIAFDRRNRNWRSSGSTIAAPAPYSLSRSTIAASQDNSRSGSTIIVPRHIVRRHQGRTNPPLRKTQSGIWTTYDEELLRRERINLILREIEDQKGFTKAVTRLPHLVLQRAGAAEETRDADFNSLSIAFDKTSNATEKLADDLKKYREAVLNMLQHQMTLLEAWKKIFTSEATLNSNELPLVETVLNELKINKREIMDELEKTFTHRILKILEEILMVQKGIGAKVTKRNHKLLDYDRYLHSIRKIEADKSRSLSDERKLVKTEQALREAEQEYVKFNDQLKRDLPLFFTLHERLLKSVSQSFVLFQKNLYRVQSNSFTAISNLGKYDYVTILREFEESTTEALAHTSAIPMIQALAGKAKYDHGTTQYGRYSDDATAEKRTGSPLISPQEVPTRHISARLKVSQDTKTTLPRSSIESSVESVNKETCVTEDKRKERSNVYMEVYKSTLGKDETFYDCQDSIKPVRTGKVAELVSKLGGMSFQSEARSPEDSAGLKRSSSRASNSIRPNHSQSSPTLPPKKQFATAIYDFNGQEIGDLSFNVGDRIEVVKKTNETNDWWVGSLNGQNGLFPGTYVSLE